MSPFYPNQASTMPIPEGDEDQIHPPISFTISNDSSFSYPFLFHALQDHDQGNRDHPLLLQQQQQQQQQQQEVTQQFMISDLSNCPAAISTDEDSNNNDLKLSLCNQYLKEEDDHVQVPAGKWMSSKMRIMRKMMKSDRVAVSSSRRRNNQVVAQDQTHPRQVLSSSNENSPLPSGMVRVCSDCHTTKTPLWRSGPCGPKSLCNACGIRQRKARRAMAAAAAAAAGGGLVAEANSSVAKARKEKKVDVVRTVPFKKRCKFTSAAGSNTPPTRKKLSFEDHISLTLSTSSSFHQVFPQDERDAAILLMALSCGPIRI